MSTIGKRTIYVGPADGANHKPLMGEARATRFGIEPGRLMRLESDGVTRSNDAATIFGVQAIVADKDSLLGGSVDDVYDDDVRLPLIFPRSGEFINQLVITGQALIAGTPLTRDGNGYLRIALTDGTEDIIAYSDEAVTTTATQLVRVRYA